MDPNWLALIQVASPVAGPAMVLAVGYFLLRDRVSRIESDLREIKHSIPACQRERREVEESLQERITTVQVAQARLQGLINGGSGIK